jgi:hypothetical protein
VTARISLEDLDCLAFLVLDEVADINGAAHADVGVLERDVVLEDVLVDDVVWRDVLVHSAFPLSMDRASGWVAVTRGAVPLL